MKKRKALRLIKQVPEDYRRDIEKAIHILTSEGCNEIYLFGSLVNSNTSPKFD
jgi:hypothetical protein